MKNIIKVFIVLLFGNLVFSAVFAGKPYKYSSDWDNDPMTTMTNIISDANNWQYKIQETALDWITDLQWNHPQNYKITNTLDYIINNLDPYLQRAIYIWLVAAVVILIYLWFLMVTNWIHKAWEWKDISKKILNVVLWVLLLTWFYAIIKLFVGLINTVFK